MKEIIIADSDPSDRAVDWLELCLRQCMLSFPDEQTRRNDCQSIWQKVLKDLKSLYQRRWEQNKNAIMNEDVVFLREAILAPEIADFRFLLNYYLRDEGFADEPYKSLCQFAFEWEEEVREEIH